MLNLDLFPETLPSAPGQKAKAERMPYRVLMHVSDAGTSESGQLICTMHCRRCGTLTNWLVFTSISESKRGIPCVTCN